MRPLRVVTLLLLALTLSSCAYLFDSPFPGYLTHAVARKDISGLIPYVDGGHYEARAINSLTGDYVWLYAEGPQIPEQFVLLDGDLDVVLQVTDTAADNFFSDSLLLFDGSGQFFCGELSFDASFAQLANNAWAKTNYGYWDPSGSQYRFLEIVPPDTVQYREAATAWNSLGASTPMVTMSAGAYNYFGVQAVAQDMQNGRVAMYAIPDFGGQLHGVVAPDNNFVGSLANPIDTDTRFFSIPLDYYNQTPQFAGDGTVVFTEDKGRDRMVFYDLDGDEIDTYVASDSGDIRYAYSPAGKYWYIMDAQSGILVKARTWW